MCTYNRIRGFVMCLTLQPNTPQRGRWAEAGVTNILGQMELETKAKWTGVGGVTNVLGEMDLEENHPFGQCHSVSIVIVSVIQSLLSLSLSVSFSLYCSLIVIYCRYCNYMFIYDIVY